MANIWDKLEELIKIIWLILISIFTPIKVAVIVLMLFFTVNFFIGFQNDRLVHGKEFSLNKAIKGTMLLGLFFILIFIANLALSSFNEMKLAEDASKFLSCIFCYSYLVNILRNSIEVFPESKILRLLYSLLTVQILDIFLSRFGLKRPDDYETEEKG